MQLNLRQAHKLVEKIGQRLGTIRLTSSTSFSIYMTDDFELALRKARDKVELDIKRQLDLLAARQEIRMSVQSANVQEVNNLVAIRKGLLEELATYRHIYTLTGTGNPTTVESMKAELEALRTPGATSYTQSISIELFDEQKAREFDNKISQLQLRVEGIEEQLSTANVTGSIQISQQVEQLLRREGIVQ